MFFMLCFMFPTAYYCPAKNSNGMENKKEGETTVIIKKKTGHNNSPDKDDPGITASISGHTLTVNFAQNIGSVQVDISDGQSFMVVTPDNVQAYITSSGSYTVNFTLSNGDEYYGNFVVF